jgi:hypothetical protein
MPPCRTIRARTLGLGSGVLALAALVVGRRRALRWGTKDDERRGSLPGDDVIPAADLVATRAIGIAAPSADVWPWIVQLGQHRGGFYSYDWLENLAGADIHNADRIVPEWQQLAVGDDVSLAPDMALKVAQLEPGRALVLHGGVPPEGPAPPFEFTWTFVLHDAPAGATRLVVRERYRSLRPRSRWVLEPMAIASFVMTYGMLRGIRARAERAERH